MIEQKEKVYQNWIFEGAPEDLESIKNEARDNGKKVERAYMGAIRVYRIPRKFAKHLANEQSKGVILKESA